MNLSHILVLTLLTCLGLQAPASFSWDDINGVSYLSEVKNQNFPAPCNSGWAISTIDMLNSRIKVLRKAQSPDISLSAQVLLSCDKFDFGCMGVRKYLFRESQSPLFDGSKWTISQMNLAMLTKQRGIQTERPAHPWPNVKVVKMALANLFRTPKFTLWAIMDQWSENQKWLLRFSSMDP